MSRWVLVFLSLLLNSCSENNQDLIKYIRHIKIQKPKFENYNSKIITIPHFKIPEPTSISNPFAPLNPHEKIDQGFNLSTLKYVGFIKQGRSLWALIEQPNSSLIRVKKGDYLERGKVRVKLIKDKVLVLEEGIKVLKGFRMRRINLYMKKKS